MKGIEAPLYDGPPPRRCFYLSKLGETKDRKVL